MMIELVATAIVFLVMGYAIGLISGRQEGYNIAKDPNHNPEDWGW